MVCFSVMNLIKKLSLACLISAIILSSCSKDDESGYLGEPIFEPPTITLENKGTHAWNVVEVDGTGVSSAFESENQTLTLKIGLRYTFKNLGTRQHPLDFRNADGELLFSQDLNVGSFEEDPSVNFEWDLNEDLAIFTLTEELALELATYNCSTHEMMEGNIIVVD